jgi:hypothetical protein
MYNLAHMTVSDMAHASTRLRKLGRGARSMEEASQRIASFFFDELGEPVARRGPELFFTLRRTTPG